MSDQDIDKLVEQAERAIELLQERRTVLISAVVTGEIDVTLCGHHNNNIN